MAEPYILSVCRRDDGQVQVYGRSTGGTVHCWLLEARFWEQVKCFGSDPQLMDFAADHGEELADPLACYECGKPDCHEPDPKVDPFCVPLCEECESMWVVRANYLMDLQEEERDCD